MFKYYCTCESKQELADLISGASSPDVGLGLLLYKDYDYCISKSFNNKEMYVYEIVPVNEKWNPSCADRVLLEDRFVQIIALHRGLLEEIKDKSSDVYNYWNEYVDEDTGVIVCPGRNNVTDELVNDYLSGMITDYTYVKLDDKFFKGYDIVLTNKNACSEFRIESVKLLSVEEQKKIIERNRNIRKKALEEYSHLRAVLNKLRRGLYFSEVKDSWDSYHERSVYDERYYLSGRIDWSKV